MDTVFIISPEYLSAVMKESKKYNFIIQGYGSFAKAIQGIMRINPADLLGVAVLTEQLPQHGSSEYKSMLAFLNKCELMESNKKVVILSKNGVAQFTKTAKKYKHLRIYANSNFETVSDTLINKNLFGSILLDTQKPYIFKEKELTKLGLFSGPALSYKPLISEHLLACVADYDALDTCAHSIEFDPIYQQFKQMQSDLMHFRVLFIKRSMHEDTAAEEKLIQEYLNKKHDENSADWPLLLSLYDFIMTGGTVSDTFIRF